ncbi:MAG: hypothetical protein WCI91_03650 [Candidatus Nomurabacteria bacterium]
MTQDQITSTFLQAFVGGRFKSEKHHLARMPTYRKGKIKAVSLDSGIITISRFRSKAIEIVLSACEIVRFPSRRKIVFESFFDGHTVVIRSPKK